MSTPPSKAPIVDESSSSSASSTRPSTPASSIASQDQETITDLDSLLELSVRHPRWQASRLGTYNVVLLPPVLASTMSNPGDGRRWVEETFRTLEKTYDELGNKTPLDMCRDRQRHLTIGKSASITYLCHGFKEKPILRSDSRGGGNLPLVAS